MRIGFVGIGTMGALIAEYLIGAGHRLTVYDLRPAAMAKLGALGAAIADSPMEAAYAAEAVFTSLPGPTEVESAALDPERGIFASLRRGGTYIDLTTNAPATIRRIADSARKRDIAVSRRPGQRQAARHDRDGRRARGRFRAVPAAIRGDRRQCLPCRAERRRLCRETGDAISRLYQLYRRARRAC